VHVCCEPLCNSKQILFVSAYQSINPSLLCSDGSCKSGDSSSCSLMMIDHCQLFITTLTIHFIKKIGVSITFFIFDLPFNRMFFESDLFLQIHIK
jgi:hypothetical protein